MRISAITDQQLRAAAQLNNVDSACAMLQHIAGITHGDVAAQCFSDMNWVWEEESVETRERKLRLWLLAERFYAEGRA